MLNKIIDYTVICAGIVAGLLAGTGYVILIISIIEEIWRMQ